MNKYGIKNIAAPYNFAEVQQVKKRAAKKIRSEQKKEEAKLKNEKNAKEIANFAKTAAANFFTEHKKKLDKQILDLKEKLSIRDNDTKLNNYNKMDITTAQAADRQASWPPSLSRCPSL